MKMYSILILLWLSSCSQQNDSSIQANTAKTTQKLDTLRCPPADCHIDTVAILTNARLANLLEEASKEDIKAYARVENIPPNIISFLNCLAGGSFTIANPNQNWNSSCSVDNTLADRQLTYLGIGKNILLITYYTGGIGVMKNALIIKRVNNQIQDFWNGAVDDEAETTDEIVYSIAHLQREKWAVRSVDFARKHVLNKQDTLLDNSMKRSIVYSRLSI